MNDDSILHLGKESDTGDTEYKYQLINFTDEEVEKKGMQMKYRLNNDQNYGQAIYALGIVDDGFALGLNDKDMQESLETLTRITKCAGAKICGIQTRKVVHYAKSEEALLDKYLKDMTYRGRPSREFDHSTDVADAKREETRKNKKGIEFVRNIAEVIIRKDMGSDYIEIRCGVAGHVDCGKSTLLGVLTRGELDNAKGRARSAIVVHNHEHE
jgi:GTPase